MWKNVHLEKYKKYYQVSSEGVVMTIKTKRHLKQHMRNGYKAVCLYNGEFDCKNTVNVHILVANAFCEKTPTQTQVNHIDGNKVNNKSNNLEWVTAQGNIHHAHEVGLTQPFKKKVHQYTLNGDYLHTYDSIIDASYSTGASDRHISCVCKGKRKSCGGFIWKYDVPDTTCDIPDGVIIPDFPNYVLTRNAQVYSKRSRKFLKPKVYSNKMTTVNLCNNGIVKVTYISKLMRDIFTPNSTLKNVEGSGENSEV